MKVQERQRSQQRQQMITLIGVIIIVAIVAAGALIVLSGSNPPTTNIDYSKLTQTRTKDGAFVLGNPEAKVTLIEFADFRCPHCQDYKPQMDRYIEDYVVPGKAKYEYRFFRTVDATGYSAQLAECADKLKPGVFFQGVDTMFRLTTTARPDNQELAKTFADKMGVSYGDLLSCAADANQVNVDHQFGVSAGVEGTPAVMLRVGDSAPIWLTGRGAVAYSYIQQYVNAALAS